MKRKRHQNIQRKRTKQQQTPKLTFNMLTQDDILFVINLAITHVIDHGTETNSVFELPSNPRHRLVINPVGELSKMLDVNLPGDSGQQSLFIHFHLLGPEPNWNKFSPCIEVWHNCELDSPMGPTNNTGRKYRFVNGASDFRILGTA